LRKFLKGAKEGKTGAKGAAELMIAYNEKAFSKFDTEALVQCKNCLRTFLPDRLVIHSRSCHPGKPLKMRAGL
jgi:hypothetical protein